MIVRAGHLSRSISPPGYHNEFQFRSSRSFWKRFPRRWVKMLSLLVLICFFSVCLGMGIKRDQTFEHGQKFQDLENDQAISRFPPPRQTQQHTHDPTILRVGDEYYLYHVGEHIFIHTAPSMAGPWKHVGSVLDAKSAIPKGDRAVPWAPDVIAVDGTYYCYYSVSKAGCRDSAIGVATSNSPGPGNWYDHGVVIQTGTGNGSDIYPYTVSNAIDPSTLVTPDGHAYLTFGSYWKGIFQIPLSKDLLSPASTTKPDERQLAWEPESLGSPNRMADNICGDPSGPHAIEGAFISYNDGWYYLWFSHGFCCNLNKDNLPPAGQEYSIRVGRSLSPRGPFTDKAGTDLVKGGGELIYGSNGETYAPGGQAVLRDGDTDVLYYHYLNTTVGIAFQDAFLGFNPLKYVDGWPIAQG
ncbi:Glycoside hydrolase family 43 [Penicillium cf. griseofulvum]|uniref:Arabinan endo-1,5-alpha-L-arabinosidase n=1 Tax=Penicillium cf. griseofulvum TaxID=2972120 RepID=A0A9W9M529_9EURO|nr:Glycoside hydrolase family 43 [Penicillium cf. griseofulvum]KAJ5452630.1 Glycoside hydrolase family 43 [Penicillium cf. griseofulvum]